MVCWPKSWRLLPGSVAALLVATTLVQVFALPVDTIGSRFGGIPAGLPSPSWPALSLSAVRECFGPATAIAFLGGIESLLSATVADGMTGYRHRPGAELVAQGVANLVSPLVGGIPATGAIARTATNIRNGATTPVAGMAHAVTLLAIMLAIGPWAGMVPMAALAAVLVVVAYHMSEWRTFRGLLSAPRSDVAVLLATFALTVVFDLTLAVQAGMVLAAFLFMKRMADVTRVGPPPELAGLQPGLTATPIVPEGVRVFEVQGPFFFGAAEKVRDVLSVVEGAPQVMILRMRHVPVLDATGLHTLEQVRQNCARSGTTLVLSAVSDQPLRALERSHCLEAIGTDNVTGDLDQALCRAREILDRSGPKDRLKPGPARGGSSVLEVDAGPRFGSSAGPVSGRTR
jgi:SulP family sulfate permease